MSTLNKIDKAVKPTAKKEKLPKGWIRWSGLTAFLSIVVVIIGLTYLGMTLFLKSTLEDYASEAWGAKVEIGSLDLGILPLRVGIYDLAVTDPDKPMENLVTVKHIGSSVNFYQWVVGRTVIEEVAVQSLAFHQPRTSSGALSDAKLKSSNAGQSASNASSGNKKSSGLAMPTTAIPNLDDVLSRDNLQTLKTAEAVKQQLNDLANDWEKLQKDLPSQTELDGYQKRFQDLTKGNFNNLADIQKKQKAFESLKKEVESKSKLVEEANDLLQKRLPKLQADVLALKDLPAKDLAHLKSQYSLDGNGLSNVTYLLFGDKMQGYMTTAQQWYGKAKPFIDNWKAKQAEADKRQATLAKIFRGGTEVKFKERDPQPDFIIKRVMVSTDIPWGTLKLKVLNVNFDQPTSQRPITYFAEVQPRGQTATMKLVGESNFTKAGAGFYIVNVKMKDYQIKDWPLSDDKSMNIQMDKAITQVNGQFRLTEQEALSGNLALNYQKVQFDLSQSQSKEVKRYMAPIFKKIHGFTVDTQVKGKLFAPDFSAKSNLDKKLAKAFNQALNGEMEVAKKKMKAELDKRVAAELGPINKQLSALLGDQAEVGGQANGIEKILSTDSNSFFKKQQKQLETKYQKQAEDKINSEKNKLGQQLLNQFKF